MKLEITLKAERRELIGKKVKQLRRQGWIPGVAYGPEVESTPVQFPQSELIEAYRKAGTSAIVGLLLGRQRRPRPAFFREVQRDPISQEILHVDFELVDLNRPVTTHVPIVLVGEAPVVERGLGVLTHGAEEVQVQCLPVHVPPRIEVDLSAVARADQVIRVGDLSVAEEVQVLTNPETVVAYVTTLRRAVEEEAEPEAVEVEEAVEETASAPAEEE